MTVMSQWPLFQEITWGNILFNPLRKILIIKRNLITPKAKLKREKNPSWPTLTSCLFCFMLNGGGRPKVRYKIADRNA